jgi:hypothetical protein
MKLNRTNGRRRRRILSFHGSFSSVHVVTTRSAGAAGARRKTKAHISMPNRSLRADRRPQTGLTFISCICKDILAV